jgi:peptide/nickel transport system substrate-binding protein
MLGALFAASGVNPRARAEPTDHAIAMHGDPAWGPSFTHPTYANPAAPKGGQLVQGVLGTFDCLNPFIVKGLPAANIRGYVIESLLARGYDEPFTLYGLLAESVSTDTARNFVTFTINQSARFADGKPVTPDDVVFSWELLRDKGRPNYRTYYTKVVKAEVADKRTVRFDLSGADDRELPLIIGLMPVLARHAVDTSTFEDTSFKPLLGSGPYTVSAVRPGETVTFKRNPNYWPTIFLRCAKAELSKKDSPTACPKVCKVWCSIHGGQSSQTFASARRFFSCLISNGSTTITSLIFTCGRQVILTAAICRRMASPPTPASALC